MSTKNSNLRQNNLTGLGAGKNYSNGSGIMNNINDKIYWIMGLFLIIGTILRISYVYVDPNEKKVRNDLEIASYVFFALMLLMFIYLLYIYGKTHKS